MVDSAKNLLLRCFFVKCICWLPIFFYFQLLDYAAGINIPPQFDVNSIIYPHDYKFQDAVTGSTPQLRAKTSKLTSRCPRYRPSCHYCPDVAPNTQFTLHKEGEIYLAGLFSWREKGKLGKCGGFTGPKDIVAPISFVYTVETFKQRFSELGFLDGVKIGAILMDTCKQSQNALREITNLDQNCLSLGHDRLNYNATIHPDMISGYVVGLPFESYSVLKDIFTENGLESIMGTSVAEKLPSLYRVFSVMPTFEVQAEAIISVLLNYDWNYVSIILSENDLELNEAYKQFKRLAELSDVCIADVIRLNAENRVPVRKSHELQASKVAIAFATADDIASYVRSLTLEPSTGDPYVFVLLGDAHNWETHVHRPTEQWKENFYGTISIQPKLPAKAAEFYEFLENLSPEKFPEPWFLDFWEQFFDCSIVGRPQRFLRACEGSERFPSELLGRITKESYLMTSVEHILFHLDALYRKYCPERKGLCEKFYDKYPKELPFVMKKIKRETEFEIYNYQRMGSTSGYKKVLLSSFQLFFETIFFS